ncbi:MAG: CHAD domain-containing protein, partial [Tepidiformaceae bacterium]
DETTVPVAEVEPHRFARVEVEVDAVAVERARRFVDVLVAAANLTPAGTSKFQAALAATGQEVPGPIAFGASDVVASQTAADAAYAILRKQFGAFLANEAGTRLGDDIEALHDMRVASRRLRAAMSAFAAYLPPRLHALRDQLGWVASALGVVRDLDVQLETLPEWRDGFAPDQVVAVDAIEAILQARRDAARKRMLAVLDSRRYDLFVLRFTAALRRGPPKRFMAGHEAILSVSPDLVERRHKRLARDGGRIQRHSPPEDYHALRIESKKLRYALEFVGPIYGKPALSFSKRVTDLQDVLGLHQDAYVAMAMLHELAATSARKLGPNALLTMGAIAERYRQQAVELRAQFPKAYRPLTGADWSRLQVLMESRRVPRL